MGILTFFTIVEKFHLDPSYFPEVTKGLVAVEDILRFGILPLGFKTSRGISGARQFLNVGFLSPRDTVTVSAVKHLVLQKHGALAGLVRYQISLPEFLAILEKIYTIDSDRIARLPASSLCPELVSLRVPPQ